MEHYFPSPKDIIPDVWMCTLYMEQYVISHFPISNPKCSNRRLVLGCFAMILAVGWKIIHVPVNMVKTANHINIF